MGLCFTTVFWVQSITAIVFDLFTVANRSGQLIVVSSQYMLGVNVVRPAPTGTFLTFSMVAVSMTERLLSYWLATYKDLSSGERAMWCEPRPAATRATSRVVTGSYSMTIDTV